MQIAKATGLGFYSMFCRNRQRRWCFTVCFARGEPSRQRSQKGTGADLAEKWSILIQRTIKKWSILEGCLGGSPGGGPGQSPEAARDEVGGKSSRRPAKTSASRRRRRRTRRQDGDDDAQNDNGDNEVDDLARRPSFTRRARCPEVALGYRLGRLLILLISPPVRHKLSPGRGRHRRRGRDRRNRRADVVGPTIVTISEKHERRRSRSHNTKTCASRKKRIS